MNKDETCGKSDNNSTNIIELNEISMKDVALANSINENISLEEFVERKLYKIESNVVLDAYPELANSINNVLDAFTGVGINIMTSKLYKVVYPRGLHLSKSSEMANAFRGLVVDESGKLVRHVNLLPFGSVKACVLYAVVALAKYAFNEYVNSKSKTLTQQIRNDLNFLFNYINSDVSETYNRIISRYMDISEACDKHTDNIEYMKRCDVDLCTLEGEVSTLIDKYHPIFLKFVDDLEEMRRIRNLFEHCDTYSDKLVLGLEKVKHASECLANFLSCTSL